MQVLAFTLKGWASQFPKTTIAGSNQFVPFEGDLIGGDWISFAEAVSLYGQ
jgi:hypothetical protein